MGELTTWKPRKVYCTSNADHSDQPGELCVGKFCQERRGAAAMISEVVCRALLAFAEVPVLDAVLVEASRTFTASWNDAPGMPFPIVPGLYFGTKYRGDALPAPPPAINDVHDLREAVNLWVMDSLVCNIDWKVWGNLLMLPHGKRKFRLVAADQSDCFCGSNAFFDGSWMVRLHERPSAGGFFIPESIGLMGGGHVLGASMERARLALNRIGEALADVPGAWWQTAQIDPDRIEQELWRRFEKLPEILRVQEWGGLNYERYGEIPTL